MRVEHDPERSSNKAILYAHHVVSLTAICPVAPGKLLFENAIGAGEPRFEVLLIAKYLVGTKETDRGLSLITRITTLIAFRNVCDLLVEPRTDSRFDTVTEIVFLLTSEHHLCDTYAAK